MLKLLYGTAGTGKTYESRRMAARCAREGKQAVLIVPEQYSFESERAMLLTLGAHDAQKVEVYSFRRLAQRLTETGTQIDDCSRAALMSLALSNVSDFLDLYSRRKKNIDFVSHMLDALKELKLCAVTPQELEQAASKAKSNVLGVKMRELAVVCAEYDRLAAETGLDPLDSLTRLAQYLSENDFFGGKTVLIDSFRGFTGQEMKVISEILVQADECVITMCTDGDMNSDGGTGLFSPVNDTAKKLIREAKKRGCAVAAPVVLTENRRFSSEALARVEKGLYRIGAEPYSKPCPEVTVYKADDIQDEARYACREIRRLLREENYRCRDIAVLVRRQDRYARPMEEEASAQGFSVFMDRRMSIDHSPLIRFVSLAVSLAGGKWRGEDMLRALKCSMIDGITHEDIALVEEYVLMWEIPGDMWIMDFTADPDGFGSEMNEEKQERLKRLNDVRSKAVRIFLPFCEEMKNASGKQRARAVVSLLVNAGSAQCVRNMCDELPEQEADVQAHVWDSLMDILDRIALITGDTVQPMDEFTDLLSLMFSAATVGQIPQGVDEVTFGAADRARTSEPRATFILGAAQGVFPANSSGTGVFTDSERRELINMDIPVTEPSEAQVLEERLLAYTALSSPSERLYVVYPGADGNESMEPSEIVTLVQKLLPGCAVTQSGGELTADMVESGDAAFELAVTYGCKNAVGASLNALLMQDKKYSSRLLALQETGRDLDMTDKEKAMTLFGRDMRLSQAKTEAFFECPFKFFCRYAMKVKPRRKARLDAIEYGNVLHYIMENIVREHYNDLTGFSRSEKLEEEIRKLIEDYLDKNMGGAEDKSTRFMASLDRMAHAAAEVVRNLGDEMEVSLFRPEPDALELVVGEDVPSPRLELEDGTVSVVGKVDRVDSWSSAAGKYIRIIDYKTGSKSFNLTNVLHGIDMQLFIYMDALKQAGPFKQCKGAGVLYSPASVDAKSAGRNSDGRKERLSQLKQKGLLTDDTEVLGAMEAGMGAVFIPAKLTAKGTFNMNSSSVASEPLMEAVCRRTRENLVRMGNTLHEGKVAPYPAFGAVKSCRYCEYNGVCGVEDPREVGHEIIKMTNEEIEQELFGKEEE